MYEVGTQVQLRAFHVMPNLPPPEGERHSHDYRIEVAVSRPELDERGMVVDLDALNAALHTLADHLTGRDLEDLVTGVDAVTVEAFAEWIHTDLARALGPLPEATLAVRIWETPTAYGGYASSLTP